MHEKRKKQKKSGKSTVYLRTSCSIGLFISRKIFANNPSTQSPVSASKYPYNSAMEQAYTELIQFGLRAEYDERARERARGAQVK